MILDVKYSDAIRLLGPLYYMDCYKFWDLKQCHDAFFGNDYSRAVQKLKNNNVHLYSGSTTMAVADFSKYRDSEYFLSSLSPNLRRDIKKSSSLYTFKEFQFDDFVPDFCDIARSQDGQTTCGKVNPWYLQSPDFFIPTTPSEDYWEEHYVKWYGIFRFLKKYKQFDKITNEKLLAYCQVAVDGEMATICLIWGHTHYYKHGIMFDLITSVTSELMKNKKIKCLVYYGWGQHPQWKKRMLFEPTKLHLKL